VIVLNTLSTGVEWDTFLYPALRNVGAAIITGKICVRKIVNGLISQGACDGGQRLGNRDISENENQFLLPRFDLLSDVQPPLFGF
jgi:hypothetical protein